MKRTIILLTTFALAAFLAFGCDDHKNPAAPDMINISDLEAKLKSTKLDPDDLLDQQIAATATITVPDDYPTIQQAVDATAPGSRIIVKASGSPYNELVSISQSKSNLSISAVGEAKLNGRFIIQANGVKIRRFTINVTPPQADGIRVLAASGVKIIENTVIGGINGISLVSGSTGCLLKKNTCTDASFRGIILIDANDNTISNNLCSGSREGINLAGSERNKLIGNTCISNSSDGIDVGNSSHNNEIRNNNCSHNGNDGIEIDGSSSNNKVGPRNTANFNGSFGIILFSDAIGNFVRNNNAHCNGGGDILDLGSGNIVTHNSTGPLPECQ